MFKTVLKIIRWTDKRRKRLYIGFLWSFLAHMFTAMPIMGAAFLLDMMIKDSRGEAELKPIWALYALIFMAVCVLGRFLFSYLKAVFQESIAYEKTAEERIKIGDILKKVSLGFFDKNKTGEICGTVTTDLSVLEMYAMKMTDTLAVAYAVDNNTIAENVFRGTQTATGSLFSRSKPYCDVDTASYDFNADKAKELLEESGWIDSDGDGVRDKDGEKLEIDFVYTSSYGSIGDGMLAIASELETVGFKVNVTDMDMMAFYTATLSGEYDMTLYRTYGGVFDPLTMMTNIYPETSMDPVAMQFAEFIPGGADTILELDSTADLDRVAEIYSEILPAIADNALCVPFTNTIEYAAWNNNIISGYEFCSDSQYVEIGNIDLK